MVGNHQIVLVSIGLGSCDWPGGSFFILVPGRLLPAIRLDPGNMHLVGVYLAIPLHVDISTVGRYAEIVISWSGSWGITILPGPGRPELELTR